MQLKLLSSSSGGELVKNANFGFFRFLSFTSIKQK